MKENGTKIVVSNFLENLPNSFPGSRVCILNLTSSQSIDKLLSPDVYGRSEFIKIQDQSEVQETLLKIANSLKEKKYIFINFRVVIPQEIYLQLLNLSERGLVDFYDDKSGKRVTEVLDDESHIILVSERKFIETQHGNLNNLSTQILDLEDIE